MGKAFFTKYSIFIVDVKSGRFMYQCGRAGDEAKKHKSPAKNGRVGIAAFYNTRQRIIQANGVPQNSPMTLCDT